MTAKYPLLTFTVMKNEGPFILEWIAYQKVFGADKILVMTNNCDDGTDLLLDRLDEMGLVRHVPNPSGMGTKYVGKANHPHIVGMTYAKLHREWREAERVLMCDVDEFPIVYVGDGSFDALMDAAGAPDVLSLSEKLFGAGDHIEFDERLLMERFTECSSASPGKWRANKGIKSITRIDPRINVRNHRPLLDKSDAAAITWKDGGNQDFPADKREDHIKGLDCRGRYELGAIHHYALRSVQSFLVKVHRGDAVAQYDGRLDRVYFRRRNRLDDVETRAHTVLPDVVKVRDELLRDETVARLHYGSIRHHRAKIYRLLADPAYAALYTDLQTESAQMTEAQRLHRDPALAV